MMTRLRDCNASNIILCSHRTSLNGLALHTLRARTAFCNAGRSDPNHIPLELPLQFEPLITDAWYIDW
jgi:hypothetical protein